MHMHRVRLEYAQAHACTLVIMCANSFAGCNVESTSADLSVGAERTTVLKAVSEGETRFRSMAMASDTDLGFPSPDGPGRQFLAEFGEFPVYLVNRDMQVRSREWGGGEGAKGLGRANDGFFSKVGLAGGAG